MTKEYLKKIANTTAQGDAREESYYPHFSNFLSAFASEIGKTKTQVTTLPKKTEAGNPDFRVWDGRQHIVGYIEAKKPGENLDVIEAKDQLKRYRSTFPNLILTDFYEFRLYRNGELIDQVSIGRPFIAKKLKTVPPIENEAKFVSLLEKFFAFSLPKVFTAENLAIELAKRTGFLRDEVVSKELEEEENKKGGIFGFYEAFKKYLVATLTQKEFADIYSQTITYGMFAARTKAVNGFSRQAAFHLIPPTIGILRDVFHFISLGKLPLQMEVIIDDIAEVLQAADVSKILNEYYQKGKGEDPIVHFYETFLNIYDPATREKRGVYYTPEPVVKYIVRSVHSILKTHFNLNDGLASNEVTLLDPAGGTLTFPAEAIKLAVKEYTSKYGEGGIRTFIYQNILANYYAFELMMAAYTIGHFKISFLLESVGFKMMPYDRFNLYLTNTLDMEDLEQTQIPGLSSLSEESHQAALIKKNEPILVIIGNPPYSGISANINKWTEKLLKENIDGAQSYYEVDGKPLGERKLWLQDDYVKFLRFAQWKIQKAGQGVVGMITNHSYLDNPTFRGMRQSLMKTFNEMYFLDLHGNALKKETAPDGGKDENVFDIRQGVSIALFIKEKDKKGSKIYHSDLFGLRSEKYKWLEKHVFKPRNYTSLKPENPWYFFIPRDTKGIAKYNSWPKLDEIFKENVSGIVTARDEFAIAFSEHELYVRMLLYRNEKMPDDFIRETFQLKDTRGWKLSLARKRFINDKNWTTKIKEILYRPFDKRYVVYSNDIVDWPRQDFMPNMFENNIAIICPKQFKEQPGALVTEKIIAHKTVSAYDINYLFPLNTYSKQKLNGNKEIQLTLHESEIDYLKSKPNISKELFETLTLRYKESTNNKSFKITYGQIFNYVYAILYSKKYRAKYLNEIKIDFPRIPFAEDAIIFMQLSRYGETLSELHLLKHSSLTRPVSKYQGKGDNDKIEKPTYAEEEKRVYINNEKYFDNISPDIWNYHIGGYQVMEKYLKDRKGRDMDDASHYCKIATCIAKTIEVQEKIDGIFSNAEKNVIEFK